MIRFAIAALAFALAACGPEEPPAVTETTLPTATTATEPPPSATEVSDADFVRRASADGLFAVRAGEIAVRKSESEDVRQFAQAMIQDHAAASDRLRSIVQPLNLPLTAELPADKQETLARLEEMSGADFDREYVSAMVEDHEMAVELFRNAAASPMNPQLQELAQTTLPALRQHLERAQQLQATRGR